jgi:TMAO reductase system sensor TorS
MSLSPGKTQGLRKQARAARRSLDRRTTLLQTAVIATVVLVFSVAIISYNAYRVVAQTEERMTNILRLAETSLATAVWQLDHDSAKDFLDAVLMDDAVVFAQVIAEYDTVAERARSPFYNRPFSYFESTPRFLSMTTEIRKYGERIGTFNLAASTEHIHKDILISAGYTLALALGLILIITQATLHFARKRLILPLQRLEAAALTIAEGNLESPVDTSPAGELATLTRAFEDMRQSMRHLIKDLQVANARLEDHRKHLEATVKERTDELERKNVSLNDALAEVRTAKRAAEKANLAKSNFLASMSHEIRTPMNAILGMADILWETELTADQARYVQVFRTAGESLLEIISDILDLSKIEAGRLLLEETNFSLGETVDKACAVIEPRATHKSLEFTCTLAPDVPDRLVGDPTRLRQVLINLLGNAVKFTERGSISLNVTRAPGHDGGHTVQFSVSDTGTGIPGDKLGSIFESFTQANSSTTREYGGTGLGLAISKQFVHMMGGRIWAESTPGQGSTFHFTANFAPSSGTPPLMVEENANAHPELPAASILMLEDSKYNAFVIQTYLKDTPCRLTVAPDAAQGLKLFWQGGFDLVLMDIQMPGMNGCDATKAIRQWEAQTNTGPTPIVALTAFTLEGDSDECLDAGMDYHLPKPVKKSTLFEVIARFVPGEGTPGQKNQPNREYTTHTNSTMTAVRAARAALGRGDRMSLRLMAAEIVDQGEQLGQTQLARHAQALMDMADHGNEEDIRHMLDLLAEHVERLNTV